MLFDRISLLSYPSSSLGTALTLARLRTHDRRGPGKPAVSKNRVVVRTLPGPRRSIGREKRAPRRSYIGRSNCSRSLKPIIGTPFFLSPPPGPRRCVAVPGRLRRRSRPAQRRRRRRPVAARGRAGAAASCPGTQPSASCAMARAWRRRGPVGTSRRVRRRSWPWRPSRGERRDLRGRRSPQLPIDMRSSAGVQDVSCDGRGARRRKGVGSNIYTVGDLDAAGPAIGRRSIHGGES